MRLSSTFVRVWDVLYFVINIFIFVVFFIMQSEIYVIKKWKRLIKNRKISVNIESTIRH